MAKYDPLQRHLRRQTRVELQMSFAEIERCLGAMLPNSAARPQWWASAVGPAQQHIQQQAWLAAGYEAFLISGADRVRFTRRPKP